jgi:uncharacterized protein YndB with AHSA1/START domain
MEVALAKEDGEMNQHTIQTKAEMLIRKPVAEVFEAFINPEITSKFWFTSGSGRLAVCRREFLSRSTKLCYTGTYE